MAALVSTYALISGDDSTACFFTLAMLVLPDDTKKSLMVGGADIWE
jgi:hypothetical protein